MIPWFYFGDFVRIIVCIGKRAIKSYVFYIISQVGGVFLLILTFTALPFGYYGNWSFTEEEAPVMIIVIIISTRDQLYCCLFNCLQI